MSDNEPDQTPSLVWLTMAGILKLEDPKHRLSALTLCIDLDLDSPLALAIAKSLDFPETREASEWLRIGTSPVALQHRRDRDAARAKRKHAAAKRGPLSAREKLIREVMKLDRRGRKA